jgi:hypothetical protein
MDVSKDFLEEPKKIREHLPKWRTDKHHTAHLNKFLQNIFRSFIAKRSIQK